MTTFWKSALVVGAAALAAAQGPYRARFEKVCSVYSKDQLSGSPPVSWRFRSCTTARGTREVEVQFHNLSVRPETFEFLVWTGVRQDCQSYQPPDARGVKRVAARRSEEWLHTIPARDHHDGSEVNLWVCVKGAST